ncbi:MAG: hypothetical protein ACOC45_04840 [Alkalispirochaetaceae bacterium]
MSPLRPLLLSLFVCLCLTPLYGDTEVQVVTAILQASSDEQRATFEKALEEAVRRANLESPTLEFRESPGGGTPRIDLTALNTVDGRHITVSFTRAGGETDTLLLRAPWDDILPTALTQALRYIEPLVDGYPQLPDGRIVLEDHFPLQTIRPPSPTMGMVGLYPTGVALKPDGAVVVAGTTFALEVDELFRVVGYPGSDLLDQGVFNYARAVASTPAGTVYFQPSQGSDIYRIVEGVDRTLRLRAGVGGYGPLTVLPDGTIITIDAIGRRAASISGRDRQDLSLFPSPDAYIVTVATGPAGNIWVYDGVDQRISIATPQGRFVDTIIPAIPQLAATQVVALDVAPSGEFLLLTRAGLWKLQRDGQPIWGVAHLPEGTNITFQQMAGIAADHQTGLIYLVDSGSRTLLRLRDPSHDGEVESTSALELRRLNAELSERGEQPALLLGKARVYEEIGATELGEVTFQHLLDLEPFNAEAAEGIERMEIARLTGEADRLAEIARSQLRNLGPATAQRTYLEALQAFEQILALRPQASQLRSRMESLQREFAPGNAAGPRGPEPLQLDELAMDNLFPGLFSTYRTNPVGTVRVTNRGSENISRLRVMAEVRRYSDFPTGTEVSSVIAPGQSMELPIRLILNSNVFEVEEDLPLQARITIVGESAGRETVAEGTTGFTLYRRSALNWRETERLGGFITPNEGNISRFALSAANVPGETQRAGFSRVFLRALRIGEALGRRGISYVEDPQTPISAVLGRDDVVDTVRLPRTTLLNRAGDCDDTTALLCSLYEAAGIPTAIITTPDHVLMAFDSGEPPTNRWLYEDAGLITFIRDGTLWLPLETTVISEGFHTALFAAARRIEEAGGRAGAGFVATEAAWQRFPTIPVPPTELNIPLPEEDDIFQAYARSGEALRREVYLASAQRLAADASQLSGPAAAERLSRLGSLHSRFGEAEAAERALREAVDASEGALLPVVHLATLYVQSRRPADALDLLRPAYQQNPGALIVNALLARAHYDLGESREGRRFAAFVTDRSPELARRYGLGGGTDGGRASGELDPLAFALPASEEELF